MAHIATNTRVDREQLLDFARNRHRLTLATTRKDGRPQGSPVTGGIDAEGRIVISTYPDRAKAVNLRRDPAATVLAMRVQGKPLVRVTLEDWGPIATGGFPPDRAPSA